MQVDFNSTLIRSSAFHSLVAKKDPNSLLQTAKTYLQQVYRESTTKRYKEIESKYFEHGNFGEEYAITMLSLHLKKMLKKNEENLRNDFITGTPDVYLGTDIYNATVGYDTKCPYSVFTMPFKGDTLNEQYVWQNHCYMYLTGATEWNTVYCLVSHNPQSIQKQKQSLWYKLGCEYKGATQEYIDGCINIEKNCIYNKAEYLQRFPDYQFDCKEWSYDIADKDRIMIFKVERDEAAITYIQSQVERARKYLIELHELQQ